MKKYYHYTHIDNIGDILESQKLIVGQGTGGVFVCDKIEDLYQFIHMYRTAGTLDLDTIVIIEFTTMAEFKESTDHNPALLGGARAFVSHKDVDIVEVINISDFRKED